MYFLNDSIQFVIPGTFPDGDADLTLRDSSVEVAVRGSAKQKLANLDVLRVTQAVSQQSIDPQWWTLERTRNVGSLVFFALHFHAEKFMDILRKEPDGPMTRRLYHTILAEGQIEIVVQDPESSIGEDSTGGKVPAVTSLQVQLGYGSSALRLSPEAR